MILSVDLGTSKLCAAAVDIKTGRALAIRSCANDTDIPGLADDLREQDPVRTRDLCFDLIRQVLCDEAVAGQAVEAIGISGQMHGVLLVDKELRPLTNLITWRDRRTAGEGPGSISESIDLLDKDAELRTGCRLAVGYGGATLRWLQRNDLLPERCTALTVAGYIAASLTGVLAIDETEAASWGLLDLAANEWDEDSVSRLGLRRDVLPPIRLSGRPIGKLSSDYGQELGVEGPAVVCSPVGDCQASVIGCAGFAADTVVLNIGTGAQISVPCSGNRGLSLVSEELDAWPVPFGGFLQLGAALCGGWSYAYLHRFFAEALRDMCGAEVPDEVMYERMNALAASAERGAGGLVVDTRFSGTRKDEGVKGSISCIDTSNLTPANLCLGVLEGVVRDLHSMYVTANSTTATRLIASGNAVRKNAVLRSVIGRMFDLECFKSILPEEATRGAAYAAAVGAGLATTEQITALVRDSAEPLIAE